MMEYRTCPKCGTMGLQIPRYVHDSRGERLERRCPLCGYRTSEPCTDAKKSLTPPEPT